MISVALLPGFLFSEENDSSGEESDDKVIIHFSDPGAEVDGFRISKVDYSIDGRTNAHLLDLYLDFDKERVFSGREEFREYLEDRHRVMMNKRVLHQGRIEAFVHPSGAGGPAMVDLYVYAKDTNNIIVLPYFKYDSNSGLLVSTRGRDYNFLGSMLPLRINLDYWYTEEEEHEIGIKTTFVVPFIAYRHDWEVDASQYVAYTSDSGIEVDLQNSLSLFLPYRGINWKLTALQNYLYEGTEKSSEDGYYLESGLSFGGDIPTGLIIDNKDITYSPKTSTSVMYKIDEKIIEDRRGVESTFSHSLSLGRIDWDENFREGYEIEISNTQDYNYFEDDWDISLDGYVQAHNEWDFIGFNSRLLGFYKIDDVHEDAGKLLRGILDDRITGDAGACLNVDLPFKMWIWFMSRWFEAHLSPFFDAALVRPENGSFDLADAWYSAGLEGFAFLNRSRSIYLRVSFGIDVQAMREGGSLTSPAPRDEADRYEIFIGFGHHY